MEHYSEELEELQQKIKGAQASSTQYNMREAILGTPTTDYSILKSINDNFDPFYQFWTTADRCSHILMRAAEAYGLSCCHVAL